MPSPSKLARRIRVYGVVQGVGFRHSTRQEARKLGITGWVRNRLDGTVEIQAQGCVQALDMLTEWLHRGPPHAQVDHVEITDASLENDDGFNENTTC